MEVPTPSTSVSRIRSHLPYWVVEGPFYKGDRLLRQFKYEQGMLGGNRRRPFTPMDINPTSVKNMVLGLDMADRVDQSFVKVHFHKMTTEYSNWLINKIIDKEAKRVVMREQFLKDYWGLLLLLLLLLLLWFRCGFLDFV